MNNDKKQVWYVSGPMSGLPDQNKPAFHAETARMRALGFEVINPAENDLGPSATWSDYMRLALTQLIASCTGIIMLPGYERSRGARLELHVASELGLEVIEAPGVSPWPQPEPSIGAEPDWAAA